jgi:4'-phosphopantetheinyl transferase
MKTYNNHFISFSNTKVRSLVSSKDYLLNSDDLIIFSIYLPDYYELISDLKKFLNPTELNRANRYHKEKDRNRFIICRSLLKFVLATQTNLEVNNISLDYNSNKKPYLASFPWLHFNVSHSEDYAVITISRNEVGIDIEYISEDFNFTPSLQDIFNDEEILNIKNTEDKKQAFYTSWTRKEAFVKALGKGIDDDFKNIPCLNGNHKIDSTLLKTTENWQVNSFNLAVKYLGAVAFEQVSTISKNIVLHTIPNTMEDLLKMIQNKT